jgi:flavin-dependent dehydrogenase
VTDEASEILVVGGGPAGCTAARLLSLWGHPVRLIAKPHPAGAVGLAESLTPSCGKFFDLLGIRDAIDAAGFVPTTGNTVWWGSTEARVATFADGAWGWQATTARLDAVMRAAAAQAGATIEERQLTPEEAAARPARFRLDCTGRTGLLAKARAGRVHEPGPRTVALLSVWRRDGPWPLPDPSHTLIESYSDGWAWSVPIDRARRAVAVMVDPQTSALVRGEGALAAYQSQVDKTLRFKEILAGAVYEGGPVGWDASVYHSTRYAGDDWLVAGDAASTLDPLSSAGVKKALASGWLAAIVIHTSVTTPDMAAVARQFFADREAEMYDSYLALTNRYLRDAAVGQAHPFWAERAERHEVAERRAREEQERAAVEAAHTWLRNAPELKVVRGRGVRLESRPAIGGTTIVLEPRLVTAADPAGVRFLHDVDVVTLVELAPACRQVPDLFEALVQRVGPTDLAAFLTALATAIARGWLVPSP